MEMDPDNPKESSGLKIPRLPNLKIPKLAVDRRKTLTAAGAAIAAMVLLLVGGILFMDYLEDRQIAVFQSHISASEADLSRVYGKTASYMRTPTNDLSVAECDSHARELAAIARYGRDVTAYHRQIVAADAVPEAYAGAQSAYAGALDNLNRAFTYWSSAAGAYDMRDYQAADRNLAEADKAWREYTTAIADYDRELRAAEEGAEVPPV